MPTRQSGESMPTAVPTTIADNRDSAPNFRLLAAGSNTAWLKPGTSTRAVLPRPPRSATVKRGSTTGAFRSAKVAVLRNLPSALADSSSRFG